MTIEAKDNRITYSRRVSCVYCEFDKLPCCETCDGQGITIDKEKIPVLCVKCFGIGVNTSLYECKACHSKGVVERKETIIIPLSSKFPVILQDMGHHAYKQGNGKLIVTRHT